MEPHKAKSLAMMANRRVAISLVEPKTKHFVGDKSWVGIDAAGLVDSEDPKVLECGVSMNLNSSVIDFDVDGPVEWQQAFAMAMKAVVGDVGFVGAYKRESLPYPTHYLFSSEVVDVVRDVVKVKSAFPVVRYQPTIATMGDHVAVEMRTAIDTPTNERLHTVLPGSVYPRKDDETQTEMLQWIDKTEVRLPECPNTGTMRRVIFFAATLYLLGSMMDEGVILGNDKFGRHSAYLIFFGWLRRMAIMYEDVMPFTNETDLRNYCEVLIQGLCDYTKDEESRDRKIVVASTFRVDQESLPGNISFMDTFRDLYSNTPKLLTDLAETLGSPPRPRELDALLVSTMFDMTYSNDAMFVQVHAHRAWDQPPKNITYMKKTKLDAMYNSFLIPWGDKMASVAKVFQQSQELRVITRKEFNRTADAGRITTLGVDEASKRQAVMLNTFLGYPFQEPPEEPNPNHYMIRWFEMTARLLTQSDEEAKWLINRVAMVLRNPEIHARTMPVLIGEEATGKSKFMDAITKIIGGSYTHQLGTKDLRQADSFTGFLEDKVFIYATEIDLTDMATQDRLKSWSSDGMIDMQGKGREAVTIANPIRLIMMATNKDELQALNQFSETEDTRLALFRARGKHECEALRAEALRALAKYENAMVEASKGNTNEAENAMRHLHWYLMWGETPFCSGTYATDTLLSPPDTDDRKRLRATQIPPDLKFTIEILNEPVVIQALAVAYKKFGQETISQVGCVCLERLSLRIAVQRIAEKQHKRGGGMLGFINNPNGKFSNCIKRMTEDFLDEEITTATYGSKKKDNKKIKVHKMPPYIYMKEYIESRFGEGSADVFNYEELCDENGYITELPDETEVFASLGVLDVGSI